MNISVDQIILYANIFFIFIIVLCGLVGFIRGTLKSGYYMVATLLILLLGWILMTPLSNKIAYLDVSNLNIVLDGIMVENPMQFICTIIERDYAEYTFLVVEGSNSLSLLEGIVGVATKLIYFILLFIGLFTVYFLISLIVWLIIRKPLRRKFARETEISLNKKISFKSRLGGLTIGLTKGLIYTLLIGIIFAGISTIGNSVENVVNQTEEIAIVFDEDEVSVVKLGNEAQDLPVSTEYQFIFDILDAYHGTIPSKVFGSVKFGEYDTTFDEALSDLILSIETDSGNLNLRKEIKKVEKILTSDAVKEVMAEGFDIKKLHNLKEEDLKEIVDTLSSLDLIKIIVPVGIEFIVNSDVMVEKFGDSFKEIQDLIKANYDQLVNLDFSSDVQKLGYAFVDMVYLLDENIGELSKIDYLSLDLQTITMILENIESLELLEVVAPVIVNYVLNLDVVKSAVEATGFTMEDLGLTGDIDYVHEMMCIKNIYGKLQELKIKMTEGKLDLNELDREKIDGFVDVLFESKIIKNAVPIVATSLLSSNLPDEFSHILTKEEIENINWENEFGPLLTAAATLFKTNILSASDKAEAIMNLDSATLNELGEYLSKSEVFVNNFDEIIIEFLKIILGDDIEYNPLDPSKGETWTSEEIVCIFEAAKKLSSGLSFDLSDSEIEDISNTLTSSKFIKKNLSTIINSLAKDLETDIITLENEEWTKDEMFATLKGLCILMKDGTNTNSIINNIISLSDEDLYVIMDSKFLSQIFANLIVEFASDNFVIPEEMKTYQSQAWYGRDGELVRIVKSLGLLFKEGNCDLNSINVNEMIEDLISCFDNKEDASTLLSSVVLCETLKVNITKLELLSNYINTSFTNNGKDVNDSNAWYSFDENNNPEQKELWNLLNSINILLGDKKYNDVKSFEIELIIENEELYPELDSEYNVVSTKVNEMLKSMIIEEAFASVVKKMFENNGYVTEVLTLPSDVNWYRKDVNNNEEYDLKLFVEAFIIVQEYFDFENIKNIVNSGSSIRKLSTSEISNLSTGMVISRIFRNNFAKLFNAIFTVEFANVVNDSSLSDMEKLQLATWWTNNMFNQADYDNVTKAIARNRMIASISAVCIELNG